MSYQINKTNGSVLSVVADGQIDQKSSDITLIGKNYSGFGEFINENFVKLLENFADTARPINPIAGQLWFDTAELKLKVYSGTQFLSIGSASVSVQQPTTLTKGDLWFSELDKQLFFYDGSSLLLLGPEYSNTQGLSGFKVVTILDSTNQPRTVLYLYVSGTLLGIFSKEQFIAQASISGFPGNDIFPGFNLATINNFKFRATSTDSDKLGGVAANSYVKNISGTPIVLVSPVSITSDSGMTLGSTGQGKLSIVNGKLEIAAKSTVLETAISINPALRTINLYENQPSSEVIIGGDLQIDGDLTVSGTITSIETNEESLIIEDKFIILAETGDSTADTDEYADGGGIILRGTTDHTILWDRVSTSWNVSEHINLAANKSFYINGVEVLSATSLGASITSIPGVTSIGIQDNLRIGPIGSLTGTMRLENNVISSIGNIGLELEPTTGYNIALRNSPRITGLADPVSVSDAASKGYVDRRIDSKTLVFSIDLSDNKSDSYIVTNILNNLAPPEDYEEGTDAKILCSVLQNLPSTYNINSLIQTSSREFSRPNGTDFALTSVSINPLTVPAPEIRITRVIKTFRIVNSVWIWTQTISLPL